MLIFRPNTQTYAPTSTVPGGLAVMSSAYLAVVWVPGMKISGNHFSYQADVKPSKLKCKFWLCNLVKE